MNASETTGVTVILGGEAGQALGLSLGAVLKDTLGLAVADALVRLQGERRPAVTGGAPEPSGNALHRPLQDIRQYDEVARQTLDTLREIATLLRRPPALGSAVSNGQLGSAAPATAVQPVNVEWQDKDPTIFQLLSNPWDAIPMAFASAHRYEQRVQELVVRGGLTPGEASESLVRSRVEAAAQDSGLEVSAALDTTRQLMNVGLTIQQSLDYLPAATKLQYGKAIAPDAVAALVKNVADYGDGSAAGVERSLGVVSWRARRENMPAELLVRRLNGGQDSRPWTQVLQQPKDMRIAPAMVLQEDVDARRGTTQGGRRATEIAVGEMLQEGGSVVLRVADSSLPAVAFAADRVKDSVPFMGAGLAAVTGQYGLAKDLLATFASTLGLDELSRRIQSVDLGVLTDRSRLIMRLDDPLAAPPEGAAASGKPPSLSISSLWHGVRSYWENIGFGPAARPLDARQDGAGRLHRRFLSEAAIESPGEDETSRALGAALAGSMLGSWSVPVVGPLIGAMVGGLTDWRDLAAQPKTPAVEGAGPEPRAGIGGADSSSAAPVRQSATGSWTFSPQISINVAGNVSDPEQLASELLPRLRRMLADFSQDRQRDALFDMVVV